MISDEPNELTRISLEDSALSTIPLPSRPRHVAVDSSLRIAIVGLKNEQLRFIDLAAGTPALLPASVTLPSEPDHIAVDASRGVSVVLTNNERKLYFVSNDSKNLLGTMSVNDDIDAFAVHGARGLVYAVNDDRELVLINLDTRAVVQTVDIPFRANAIAIDEALDRAILTTDRYNRAYVLDLAVVTPQTTQLQESAFGQVHALPTTPGTVAIQPDTHVAVVASPESDTLSLVDLQAGTTTPSFASLPNPFALVVGSRYNQALVLSAERNDVSFVQLPNPVPVLEAVEPAEAAAGSAQQTLVVTGKRFVDTSQVHFGTEPLITRWQSHTQLKADVTAEQLAQDRTVPVTVKTPAPGGGVSNAISFVVVPATPILTSISPAEGLADGQQKQLTLTGENFKSGATVLFGDNVLAATVNSPVSLSVTIPGELVQVPGVVQIAVVNPGNYVSSTIAFSLAPALAITDVVPATGDIGDVIALIGTGFGASPGSNQINFTGAGGNAVPALPLTASTTQLTVRVPALSESGPIRLTNARGTTQSPVFIVKREEDYQLLLSPASLEVYQGASSVVQTQLSSTGTKNYMGLVTLAVQGLPAGVSATFNPTNVLSASQAGMLTVSADSTAVPGSYAITVVAESKEAGQTFQRIAQTTVHVKAGANVTGVKGRFITPEGVGIPGIIVRADLGGDAQPQTTSDAAGNFLITGLPVGVITMRFDATPVNPLYPIWPHNVEVQANDLLVMEDWIINPPPADDKFSNFSPNNPVDQVITDPRFPGLEIRIPAGTSIIGWDGVPKARMAVERLDPDKLPVAPPPIKTKSVYQLYFGSAMGGLPSQPIPVTLPNDLGLEPGTQTPLWYYDGSPMGGTGEWKQGGMGTVSADGTVIITDSGSGIPRFCGVCGLPCFEAAQDDAPNPPCPECEERMRQKYGKPVTLATGQELASAVDLVVDGEVPIVIKRRFNPFDAFAYIANFQQSLGINWTLNYDVAMMPFSGDHSIRIVLPGNARADFSRGADGKFRSHGYSSFDGAEISKIGGTNPTSIGFLDGGKRPPLFGNEGPSTCFGAQDTHYIVRFRDGRQWRFDVFPAATGVRIRGGCLALLTEMRDAQGRYLQINRASNGQIGLIQTSSGQHVNFSYSDGVVSSITDSAGRTVSYDHEWVPTQGGFRGLGAHSAGTGASRAATESAARGAGLTPIAPYRLTSASTPDGVYAYTYEDDPPSIRLGGLSFNGGGDGSGSTAAPLSPESPTCRNVRGGTRIKTIQLPGVDGVFTNYYGPSKRVLRQTWPDGTDIRFKYKVVGGCVPGLISRDTGSGGGSEISDGAVTTTCQGAGCARYDSWDGEAVTGGTVVGVEVTDSNGKSFSQDFNAAKLPIKTVDENGQEVTIVRDTHNRILRKTDALGRTTFYGYDNRGNRTRIVDPAGRETQISFDSNWAKPTSVRRLLDDGTPIVYQYTYNSQDGTLKTARDPEGNVTEFYYDANKRLSMIRDPLGQETKIAYDSKGNPRRVTDALGNSIVLITDQLGRVSEVTDALGYETKADYNARNQLTKITDANDGATRFNFNARNKLEAVVNPLDKTIERYDYDTIGRLSTKTDAINQSESYEYDGNGNLTQLTDRRGQVTNIEYSPTNLPMRVTFHDGTVQERTYDAVGRLTEIREPDNAQRITYDVLDRVTEVITDTQAGQTTLAYEYDALDRRTKRTVSFPGGTVETTTYTYDNASRLKAIALNGPNGAHTTSYEWDSASRLAEKVLSNGIKQSFTYDAANRLTDLIYTRADGTPIEHVRYEYDANGQRIAKGLSTGTVREAPIAATYDDANRMTSVTLFPGTAGEKTYALTYDLHGNLEKKQNAADPAEQTTYTWDARNRLTSISATDATGTRTADFKYDAMGRRIERNIVQGGVSQTTQYVYDGLQAIGELDSGNLAATTLTGLNIDEVLARTVNIATATAMNPIQTKSYITDALGSVLAMSHQDQSTQPYYAYSPYGETQMLGADPDIPSNPAQYTARENDGTIGGTDDQSLYYYRARYYDPVLKRFIAEDPIGLAGGINTYLYVEGQPTMMTDPVGLKGWYCQRPLGKPPGTLGPPLLNHQYLCVTRADGTVTCGGLTTDGNILSGAPRLTRPDEDYYDQESCKEVDDDKDRCFEQCVIRNFSKSGKPRYGIGPLTDCQEYADDLYYGCKMLCNVRKGGW